MATIVMKAEQVIQACETTIARIEAKRLKEDEDNIAKAMQPTKFCGLTFKGKTRERAISSLREYRWGIFPSCYAWGDLAHAKDLLRLAQRGDLITLNEKDCRVIF